MVNLTVKSLKSPSSRFPTPPEVSQHQVRDHRRSAGIDAPALAALRLRAPGVGRVAVAPAARARAADARCTSYHHGPFGPYSAMSSTGAMPAFLGRLGRREGRRRTSSRAARRCRSRSRRRRRRNVPASANRASRRRRSPASRISNRLCSVVGRRRSPRRRRSGLRQTAGRPALAARAGQVGVARARLLQRAAAGRRRDPRPPAPTRPIPQHPATRRRPRATPRGERASGVRCASPTCDEVRQRWTPTPRLRTIDSSCHLPFRALCDRRLRWLSRSSSRCRLRSDAPPPMKNPSPSPTLSRPSKITRRVWRS